MCCKLRVLRLRHLRNLTTRSRASAFLRLMRRAVLPGLGAAAVLSLALVAPRAAAASFQEQSGFVVMEAENFDVNVTQPAGAWVLATNALATDPYSGWGYLKATGVGGTSSNLSPHADFKVNFTTTGPHYIWVSGSDAGGRSVHLGLDGVVPSTAYTIGYYFGLEFAGELWWDDQYNPGGGYINGAYLNVPTTGEHTVNLFFRQQNTYVDRIVLTTSSTFVPSPLNGGANSGYNVPAETLALSASLAVAITQPAPGKSFPSNTVVTVAAKPFTNGPAAVTKTEFFSALLPSGTDTKIGEATARSYQIGWTNPPIGNYALKAKVTDSGSATATSAVVNVTIVVPNTCPTPLVWVTNTFATGLESFTVAQSNHVASPTYPDYRIDFDWANSANAGGPAGELGGNFARIGNTTAYVAEPLSRPVSLNDELWFRSSLLLSNGGAWNTDFFFGYFDTNSPDARVGFKILNPDPWRFRLFAISQAADKINLVADCQVGQFEFRWIPSGVGDGSGKAVALVAGNWYTNSWSTPGAATFNAFGWLIPYQPTSEPQAAGGWFDNVEHKVPGFTALKWQRVGNQLVLSWGADGYSLQYNEDSLANPGAWVNSPDPVVLVGRTYYTTNTISPGTRFLRLKLNCL